MNSFPTARQSTRRPRRDRDEDGYVLLTLLLMVALIGIFALAAITPIKFALQRDQEQEMIHRGVQYSRAIRAYYKKFGRYPTKLEDLDNTNNLRYLRKHYKDPLNKNQDFKLLHYGDPDLKLGGIGGGGIAGATPAGAAMNASSSSGSGFGSSSFGGSNFGGSNSASSAFGGSGSGNSGVNSNGVFAQSSAFGGSSNGGFGSNSNSQTSANQQVANSGGSTSGSDPSQPNGQVAPGTAQGDTSSSGQQVIGGGPIVGVASISKKDTIREFNKKKKYNEWQFVYDPTVDRGGLITTPYQPALQTAGMQMGQNGQPGSTNGSSPFGQSSSGQSSFGQSSFGQSSSSFGQSSSFGNNNPTPTPPAQPPANSQ